MFDRVRCWTPTTYQHVAAEVHQLLCEDCHRGTGIVMILPIVVPVALFMNVYSSWLRMSCSPSHVASSCTVPDTSHVSFAWVEGKACAKDSKVYTSLLFKVFQQTVLFLC